MNPDIDLALTLSLDVYFFKNFGIFSTPHTFLPEKKE
jgi:hypothetical protein